MPEKTPAATLQLTITDSKGVEMGDEECLPGIYTLTLELIGRPDYVATLIKKIPVFSFHVITTLEPNAPGPFQHKTLTTVAHLQSGTQRYVMGTLDLQPGKLSISTSIWRGINGEPNNYHSGNNWVVIVRE